MQRVGKGTYHKDGGIDIVAWPRKAAFPFLMAIQVKHHGSPTKKTGPGPVRELAGVVRNLGLNAGVLVTNTTFTPSAAWVARQTPMLIHLKDIDDIKRWLTDNFLEQYEWQDMPEEIVVCPGVVVRIPRAGKP